MPKFKYGKASLTEIRTCHPLLQRLAFKVIEQIDTKVWQGGRTKEEQAINVAKGVSWTMDSKHIRIPSMAIDMSYWPMEWTDTSEDAIRKHYHFAGIVKATAYGLGIKIRWGGDWDQDNDLKEEKRRDLVHFELVI